MASCAFCQSNRPAPTTAPIKMSFSKHSTTPPTNTPSTTSSSPTPRKKKCTNKQEHPSCKRYSMGSTVPSLPTVKPVPVKRGQWRDQGRRWVPEALSTVPWTNCFNTPTRPKAAFNLKSKSRLWKSTTNTFLIY